MPQRLPSWKVTNSDKAGHSHSKSPLHVLPSSYHWDPMRVGPYCNAPHDLRNVFFLLFLKKMCGVNLWGTIFKQNRWLHSCFEIISLDPSPLQMDSHNCTHSGFGSFSSPLKHSVTLNCVSEFKKRGREINSLQKEMCGCNNSNVLAQGGGMDVT